MARFADWWSRSSATPAAVAAAAARAGVLVETGDNYVVGWFDFGDGGPPAGILAPGAVCVAHGANWLVYPAGSAAHGWAAQPVSRTPEGGFGHDVVRQLGAALDAEQVLAALLAPQQTPLTGTSAA